MSSVASLRVGIDSFLDCCGDGAALEAHGLHLLAAERRRATGRDVLPGWRDAERLAAVNLPLARSLLARIASVLRDPVIVLKGPEIALRYPDPAARTFGDIDLLVVDRAEQERRLLDAGFILLGRDNPAVRRHHHGAPLALPGWPHMIELHREPGWLPWMTPPSVNELFALAVPGRADVPGVLTLPDREHALYLAAHGWRHAPLGRLRDLVDVVMMADGVEPEDLAATARRWGMRRVWRITEHATSALFGDQPGRSRSVKTWARHLPDARERTALTERLSQLLAGLAADSPAAAASAVSGAIGDAVRGPGDQSWPARAVTIARRARRSFDPASVASRHP